MNARRRPWWRSTYVILAASVLFAAGAVAVGTTLATFSAETDNTTSTFPAGFIGPPTGLAISPSGYDASLTWTPGTHGPVVGQQLYYQDNGSSSSCPASGYSLVANMASAATSSYTASNPASTTLSSGVGITTLKTALPTPTTITTVGGINASATSFTVASTTGMPNAPFVVQVDNEDMDVTTKSGTTLTVTRAYNSTTGASHAQGASVDVATVLPNAITNFPTTNGFTFQIGTEDMTVTSGANTTTWIVTRGANSTTIAAQASNAALDQISIAVANRSGFPQSGNFTILIDTEQITVTSGQGTGAGTWLTSIANRGVSSTTIAGHASGAHVFQTSDPVDGHYYCYEMTSTSATNWTGTTSFGATQMGLVMTGLAINTSVTANSQVSTGDVVTATFNQAYATLATVSAAAQCESWTATGALTIYLNDVAYTAGTCTASPTYLIKITGLNNGAASASTSISAKATVTLPSSTTVTWTFTAGIATNLTGTAVGTPANTILSSATTDQAPACTSVTYNCTPTFTGHGF